MKMYLDKFGINYGKDNAEDVSVGWKALWWWIPQQIKEFFQRIYWKVSG